VSNHKGVRNNILVFVYLCLVTFSIHVYITVLYKRMTLALCWHVLYFSSMEQDPRLQVTRRRICSS